VTRPILNVPIGFAPSVVDKVERLLEVLSVLREDPFLRGAFVLHGGTALNVFYERAPRLSVDIDLMFVGAADVDTMRAQRPEVDARFREIIGALGYVVQGLNNNEHSGQSYRVKYSGDYVKVDISYLARVPMLDPEERICQFADPGIGFSVLALEELAAGKVKAMMERTAARDLFDLYRLSMTDSQIFSDPLSRALAVRAICTSAPFPSSADPVSALDRFRDLPADFVEPLYATLSTDDIHEYNEMIENVARGLSPLSSLTAAEQEFMDLLDTRAEYRPELLFADWPDVLKRASVDPVMAWKVENLSLRPSR